MRGGFAHAAAGLAWVGQSASRGEPHVCRGPGSRRSARLPRCRGGERGGIPLAHVRPTRPDRCLRPRAGHPADPGGPRRGADPGATDAGGEGRGVVGPRRRPRRSLRAGRRGERRGPRPRSGRGDGGVPPRPAASGRPAGGRRRPGGARCRRPPGSGRGGGAWQHPGQRSADSADPRAHGCGRDDLRSPSQRDRGRRGTGPEVRECRHPARWIGRRGHECRDGRDPARRLGRHRPAGGRGRAARGRATAPCARS